MNRKMKIYLFVACTVFVLMFINEFYQPKKVSWEESYQTEDKMPYGLYVLDQELPSVFNGSKFISTDKTPYELFTTVDKSISKNKRATLLSISGNNAFDNVSTKAVLDFVARGNTLFISANEIDQELEKKLKFKIGFLYLDRDLTFELENRPKEKFHFESATSDKYFSDIDSSTTEVVGRQFANDGWQPNFIKIKYKKGFVFIHTQPIVFTNYNLLRKDGEKYASHLLSYANNSKIFWINTNQIESTLVRYILSEPALKSAWFLLLLGIFLFLFFNAKRRQRPIPIIEPYRNTTIDFVKTIGHFYLTEKNYNNLIQKKINYFLEQLRTENHIDTSKLDENFILLTSSKLAKPKEDVVAFVKFIERTKRYPNIGSEEDLLKLNRLIENLR